MPLSHHQEPWAFWLFEDSATGDQLRLVPERGGLVTGWRCGGLERLYLDEARFADPALSVRGGIPVLFPLCGNLPGDPLCLEGQVEPLRQHGFARDLPWQLAALDDDRGVALTLEDSAESRAQYPFAFTLRLELRLEPGALAITARLRHTGAAGSAPMPFSFGLHPYFAVPALDRLRIEGLGERCLDHLTMAPAATADLLPRLGSGVDLFCDGAAEVRLLDPAAGLDLRLETTPPFDCVVVWSEPPRPMVCLEPWTAPRQALLSGDRLLRLAPGEEQELCCRYRVAA